MTWRLFSPRGVCGGDPEEGAKEEATVCGGVLDKSM